MHWDRNRSTSIVFGNIWKHPLIVSFDLIQSIANHGMTASRELCVFFWLHLFCVDYSDIYAVCVAIPDPLGERLYFKTKECLEAHVRLLYDVHKYKLETRFWLLSLFFRIFAHVMIAIYWKCTIAAGNNTLMEQSLSTTYSGGLFWIDPLMIDIGFGIWTEYSSYQL